ncbi:MAG: MerR family transcriptional regulator [Prevotellaceae bacterium]|jgi:DNA-binding transcriptional MerR regulator|nr:MerR family transcriptional regulator [Prevotellaceae bacterium]
MNVQADRIYNIGEVADILGETVPNVRYWSNELEAERLVSSIRNAKGNRKYTLRDLETLRIVYHLVRERKFTLEGAKQKIVDNREGEMKNLEIINKLNKIKKLLLSVRNTVE